MYHQLGYFQCKTWASDQSQQLHTHKRFISPTKLPTYRGDFFVLFLLSALFCLFFLLIFLDA